MSDGGAQWHINICNSFNQAFKCFTTHLSWDRQRNKFPKFWSSQLILIFKAAHWSFLLLCKNNIDETHVAYTGLTHQQLHQLVTVIHER